MGLFATVLEALGWGPSSDPRDTAAIASRPERAERIPSWRSKAVTPIDVPVPFAGKGVSAKSVLSIDDQQRLVLTQPGGQPLPLGFAGVTHIRPPIVGDARGIRLVVDTEARVVTLFLPRTAMTLRAPHVETGGLLEFHRRQVRAAELREATVAGRRDSSGTTTPPAHG